MATTLYVIVTLILFCFNLLANISAMALNTNEKFPTASFVATIFSLFFVVWGIVILAT